MSINSVAQDHCSAGVFSYTRWRADASGHLDAAIEADANFALPKLVKAWVLQGARDTTFTQSISDLVKDIECCMPAAQGREQDLLAALQLARSGKGVESATALESMLHKEPTDLLVHQLLHEGLFWMGRADWMRDVIEKAIPAWDETRPFPRAASLC